MKTYEKYKDSGVAWLGKIPEHWKISSAKRYVIITNGTNPNSEGDIPVYGSGKEPFKTCGEYKEGPTVLLGRKGTINNPIYVEGKYWNVDTAFDVKTRNNDLSLKYYYYLSTRFDYDFYMTQTAIPSMTQTNYNNMLIPVPPLAEQETIVKFLDYKVSRIEKLILIRERQIVNLKELKKTVINKAVTKGLHDVPMKDSGVKWLGKIPACWRVVKLRQLLKPISIKNHPELTLLSVVRELGVIVRDVEDREENHNFIPDDLSNYKVVRKGQFVINKMKAWQGSCGVSNYDGIVSPAYFVFDLKFDNQVYFNLAIRSKVYVNFFAQASDGIRVGQWDLQIDKMKEIPFMIPSPAEQNEIAEYLDKKCTQIDKLITIREKQITELNELKARLISDAVTGKIDVR